MYTTSRMLRNCSCRHSLPTVPPAGAGAVRFLASNPRHPRSWVLPCIVLCIQSHCWAVRALRTSPPRLWSGSPRRPSFPDIFGIPPFWNHHCCCCCCCCCCSTDCRFHCRCCSRNLFQNLLAERRETFSEMLQFSYRIHTTQAKRRPENNDGGVLLL